MDGINLHVGSVSLIMLIRVLIVIWLWRIQPRASTSFSHTVSFTFVTSTIPFLFAKAKPNTNHGYDQVDSETYERVGIERNRPLDWKRATTVKWSVVFWESRNLECSRTRGARSFESRRTIRVATIVEHDRFDRNQRTIARLPTLRLDYFMPRISKLTSWFPLVTWAAIKLCSGWSSEQLLDAKFERNYSLLCALESDTKYYYTRVGSQYD